MIASVPTTETDELVEIKRIPETIIAKLQVALCDIFKNEKPDKPINIQLNITVNYAKGGGARVVSK